MKIALLVPGFSSDESDWCIPALLDLVRVLAREAEVHVFTLRWPREARVYRVHGATVHALGGRPALGAQAVGLWLRTIAAITAEHRRSPFAVVHAFWADEPAWVGAVAARRCSRPLIVSVAGGELIALPEIDYGLLQLRGRGTLARMSLRRASLVGVGSTFLQELVGKELPDLAALSDKIRVLPLGVDLDRFTPGARRPVSDTPSLLNVGSLTPVKDQARLIRLLPRVEGHLSVGGDGPLAADLRARAERRGVAARVSWRGAIDHGAMPQLYREADVFVQTSRYESQGLAVLEAAACGVPVVGTPVGVLRDIGRPCHQDRELVAAIQAASHEGEERRALIDGALHQVHERYALDVCAQGFLSAYGSV